MPTEMALVGKPAFRRHLCYRGPVIKFRQEFVGVLYSVTQQVLVGREAHYSMEQSAEMERAQSRGAGCFLQA